MDEEKNESKKKGRVVINGLLYNCDRCEEDRRVQRIDMYGEDVYCRNCNIKIEGRVEGEE